MANSLLRDFSVLLLSEVKKRPCLYDRNAEGYKDRAFVEGNWQEIGDILGITRKSSVYSYYFFFSLLLKTKNP